MRATLLLLLGLGGSLLAACGSRDAAPPPAPAATTAPTAVAAATPATLQSLPLARTLPANSAPAGEHDEPIDVGALKLPQPDDAEPEPVR